MITKAVETKKSDAGIIKNDLIIGMFCFSLALVILAIDLFLPLGIAAGVPYVLPVLLSFKAENNKITLVLSSMCSVFILIGYFEFFEYCDTRINECM